MSIKNWEEDALYFFRSELKKRTLHGSVPHTQPSNNFSVNPVIRLVLFWPVAVAPLSGAKHSSLKKSISCRTTPDNKTIPFFHLQRSSSSCRCSSGTRGSKGSSC